MKKVGRIFLVLGVLAVILFAFFIFSRELKFRSFFAAIERDPMLLILVFSTLLGFFSLSFNMSKFSVQPKKKYYRLIRIGDLSFSVYIFVLSIMGLVDMLLLYMNPLDSLRGSIASLQVIAFYGGLILLSVALFVDNLRFHKSLLHFNQEDSIEDIGK